MAGRRAQGHPGMVERAGGRRHPGAPTHFLLAKLVKGRQQMLQAQLLGLELWGMQPRLQRRRLRPGAPAAGVQAAGVQPANQLVLIWQLQGLS